MKGGELRTFLHLEDCVESRLQHEEITWACVSLSLGNMVEGEA
jgi:hypothetical protein